MVEKRPPCLLWANVNCLLDTTSGAAMAVREMLLQLHTRGWNVKILGATNFDDPAGTAGLRERWPEVKRQAGGLALVDDGGLTHRLYVTVNTQRGRMTNDEEGGWFSLYQQALDNDAPDLVFYYGGQPFDFLIANEAKRRNIPVAFYLANGNFRKRRWQDDVDLVLTDSHATAKLYKDRLGIEVIPLGSFIDPARIMANQPSRERVLFVNPVPEKGATVVARLALWLEERRPDIIFEVVEARGKWANMVRLVTRTLGIPRDALANTIVTSNTDDMRPIYGRARLLVAPSLSWESSGRVLAEAALNGLPVVCTNQGGMPEMVGDAGIRLDLPARYYEQPYTIVPEEAEIAQLGALIESLYDDPAHYDVLVRRAHQVGRARHGLDASTNRLLAAFERLLG